MSLEVIYRLSAQTPGVNNAVIIRDGVRIGTTPLDTSVRTTSLAALGGTTSYIAEKTGYKSNTQYKLFLIRNPYFVLSEENNSRRELDRVLFEYGPGVRNFNTSFNKSFPEFFNNTPNTESLNRGGASSIEGGGIVVDDAFPDSGRQFDDFGNPINNDPFIQPDFGQGGPNSPIGLPEDTYSNVPLYVIAVLKYIDGVWDESFVQLASSTNEILMQFDLVAEIELPICDDPNALNFGQRGICIYEPGTPPSGGDGSTGDGNNDDIVIEEPPQIFSRFITIKSNIPQGISVIVNNDISQTLTNPTAELQSLDGSLIKILSSDIQRFRITRIVRGEGRNSIVVAETQNESQTVSFDFQISKNEIFTVNIEEVSVIEPTPRPQISLVGTSVKTYNINNPATYFSFGIVKVVQPVERVRVVVGNNEISFSDLGASNTTVLNINTNLFPELGTYKVQVIPFNQERGDGDPISFDIQVISEQFVGVPDIRKIKYPERITAPDFVGYDVNFSISYETKDTDYINLTLEGSSYVSKISPTGKIDLNFLDLLTKTNTPINPDLKSSNITIGLTPFNTSGLSPIQGKKEIITIRCDLGKNQIQKPQVANRFVDAFLSQIDFSRTTDDTSKLLTHNLHLGDGDNKIISNWVGSEGTLIAKLYEPLPTSVQENQQVWISKLQSNPIVETVTLSGDDQLVCSPLKGPNFSLIPDNGLGYQIYDNLIASGSATSDLLINKYFNGLNIDTIKLDIQYTSGSSYAFENFVNFGSAEERANNFYYKIQLLENYVSKLNSLTDGLELGQILTELDSNDVTIDGIQATSPVLFTEDEVFTLDVQQRVYRNPTEKIEADKVINNIRTLLASFDGFENFLYTSNNSLAWPKVVIPRPVTQYPITVIKNSQDSTLISWFNELIAAAAEYDKNNINYIINNIPLFVKNDVENSEFLLFFDMIGQHFDVIWVYINSLKKLRKNDEAGIKGVPKEFVHTILKSFGWDGLRAYDSQFLWEYALGQTKEGQQKYSTSLEDANNQIWKRILNNLPYLLKHKGTARAMKAIMATYGVPQTMLTIMEFGGPQDPEESGTTDFTFDDRTAALHLYPSASIDIPWKSVSGEYPYSIEFMVKPQQLKTSRILSSDNFTLDIIQTGSKAYLEFDLDGETTQSIPFAHSTDNYSGILISRTTDNYEVLYKTSDGERIYVESSLQLNTVVSSSWETDSVISIGNDFTGALDEVRLWRVPLEETKFENHVLFPNSINGNSYTASTADLLFRLDFEYPIDFVLGTSTVPPDAVKNVSINTSYGVSFASASNFDDTLLNYPYSYEPYERTVTTKVPSLGYNYANKIRTEEQTLIGNLSHKKRATKGSFDRDPIDSSRLGLFFSPIKELNMDIVKSLGDFNIDNYIGDPSDEYKSEYSELATLRNYYFERIDRNSHEYIRLVKYISKSLFDVLASLAPARAKVSKGLLIEPHFLERSKTRWDKPNSLRNDFVGEVSASEDTFFETENINYLGLLNTEDEVTLVGDERFFNTILDIEDATTIEGDDNFYDGILNENTTANLNSEYLTYTASIVFELTGSVQSEYDSLENFTSIGTDPTSLSVLGFGLFAEDTTTIWKRFNKLDNTLTSSRSDVYLLEETLSRKVPVQVGGYPTIGSQPGDPIVVDVEDINYVRRRINILPYGSDEPGLVGKVTKVTPLQGYFPTHYRFVNGLSTGLERSFFEGSKQTIDTTPDGLSPVETFETNPNILRVTDTGRGSGEPILEVD